MIPEPIETHKFLPSGAWEGFYCYNDSSEQHKMATNLEFAKGKVTGSGMDDIAPFSWNGKYDLNLFKINKTKIYTTHNILYTGDIDENGIWGVWKNMEDRSKFDPKIRQFIERHFKDKLHGGFHIWPKKNAENAEAEEEQKERVKSLILEEIYIEHFS